MPNSPDSWFYAENLLRSAIDQHLIPGCVAAAGHGHHLAWEFTAGMAQQFGQARPMTQETIFDMASLTKVMATLPSILLLASRGAIILTDSIRKYLPPFHDAMWEDVTVARLLTHTAGLAPRRSDYPPVREPQDILEAIVSDGLAQRPGSAVMYNDLGFVMLGEVVAHVTGQTLATFAQKEVFRALGMTRTNFGPIAATDRVAATEVVDGTALCGIVHDKMARVLGGIAGHAGLFSTVNDVVRYIGFWLNPAADLLSPWVRQSSQVCHTEGLGGCRSYGWVMPGDAMDVSGDFWPPTTCGHTGFTGTSLQFDPASGMWAVLLTNRIHLGRHGNINPLRKAFHNIVAQAQSLVPEE